MKHLSAIIFVISETDKQLAHTKILPSALFLMLRKKQANLNLVHISAYGSNGKGAPWSFFYTKIFPNLENCEKMKNKIFSSKFHTFSVGLRGEGEAEGEGGMFVWFCTAQMGEVWNMSSGL